MEKKIPVKGTGHFQWNAGGWWGSQVGSTCWLLLAGCLLLATGQWHAGLVALAGFIIPNVFGVILWGRRDRMAPYPAIQALIAVIGVCSLFTMLGLHQTLVEPDDSSTSMFGYLLMFPAIMGYFHYLEKKSRQP